MQDIYDVAIVGAGPGGTATAHFLAAQGLRVLLLDKFMFPRDKTCGDALTPRALYILDEMGVLDDLLPIGYHLNNVAFFAPKGHSVVAPVPQQKNQKCNSLLFVPRLRLDNILLERAKASGAEFHSPVRVTDILQDGQYIHIQGEQHRQIVSYKARMTIMAVGANINLLLRMGVLKRKPQVMLCSRAYFDNIQHMPDSAHCRFDGVPLPGYGWIFPISDSMANVGIGFFRIGITARWMPATSKEVFNTFIQTPPLQSILKGAHLSSPIKGYPIRVDFAQAPTVGERMLLVGEAAGLVNPVTGEGIDYALESGKMAAEYLLQMFADGDFSPARHKGYDALLRQHYQRLFVLCDRLRFLYLNPLFLNRVIRSVAKREELMKLFMNIAIDNQDAYQGLAPRTIAKSIFG